MKEKSLGQAKQEENMQFQDTTLVKASTLCTYSPAFCVRKILNMWASQSKLWPSSKHEGRVQKFSEEDLL